MSTDLIKYAFVAGELSPTFYGRTDLTKYDLAMAEAFNCFVDYRGGLSSRPGFEFVDYIPDYSEGVLTTELIDPPLFFTFIYDPDAKFNFVGLMCQTGVGQSTLRFLQNGAYVKEPAKIVTSITLANPAVVTAAAHGFVTGDWVTFVGVMPDLNRTVIAQVIDANTFGVKSITTGLDINSLAFAAYTSGGTVARVLTLAGSKLDYLSSEYKTMCVKQYRDIIRITHAAHPIRNLIRSNNPADGTLDDAGNVWHMEDEVIGSDKVGPIILSKTASAAGAAQVLFAVTSVYADGSESIRGPLYHITGIVNYPATEGSVSIVWTQDPLAVHYNVYRSIVSVTEVLSSGTEVGFIGQVTGTKYTDPNIIPDFTRVPPKRHNPFAVQPIAIANVTTAGAGYTDFTSTVTAAGAGTAFRGEAVVNDAGALVNINILDGGHDYAIGVDQTAILSVSGGAGAVIKVTVNDTLGTFPAISCVFQQRQLYAGSYDKPTTIWGSQIKLFSNFDNTSNLVESDSFEFTIDTPSFSPIRYLIPSQGGLLVMTQDGVWVLNGGGPMEPITPTNAVAVPQTFNGVGLVHPLKIGTDLLYAEGKGHAVRLLAYNEIYRMYSGEDKSILSNHLFGLHKDIISWAYQEAPYKVVWAVRRDGQLLAFTIVKAEDVYAWTPCGTTGQFLSIVNIREDNAPAGAPVQVINDRVYVITQRFLQGKWKRMIERMALRNFNALEDAYCVDCGVSMPVNYKDGNLNVVWTGTAWNATTDTGDGGALTAASGAVLRADGHTWTVP